MDGEPLKILLVEDIPVYASLLKSMLASSNINVSSAISLREGINEAEQNSFAAILLDLGLPDSEGIETFIEFQNRLPETPIIILSGLDDEQLAAKAVQLGAQDYLLKGTYLIKGEAGKKLLVRSISYAIERQQIQAAMRRERNLLEIRVAERTAELRKMNELLIRELSERKRYEFIANASKDLLSLIDQDYRYEAVNDAYCQAQNVQRQDIIGRSVSEVWGTMVFETLIKPHLDLGFKGNESKHEGWFDFKTLGYRYFEVFYYPFINLDSLTDNLRDEITHVVVVSKDETRREIARERLRQHNYRLTILREIDNATLAARSPKDIASIALKHLWRLVPYHRVDICLFSGYKSPVTLFSGGIDGVVKEERGRFSISSLLRTGSLKAAKPHIVNNLNDISNPTPFEKHLLRNGACACLIIPLTAEGQKIGFLCFSSNEANIYNPEHIDSAQAMSTPFALMIRNAQLFEQDVDMNEHLRALTARLVSAQEDERRIISRELHDEAGQSLTAIKLNLALIQSELPDTNGSLAPRFQETIRLTEITMEGLRALAHGLRPPALDEVNLNQALKDYCQRIARQTGMQINFITRGVPDLPGYVQVSLYRAAQEGLTNIIKHARATQVDINLECDAEMVILQVKDNGCGFTQPAGSRFPTTKGIGLVGIQERMEALGGKFEIESQLGQGTCLVARIPVQEDT